MLVVGLRYRHPWDSPKWCYGGAVRRWCPSSQPCWECSEQRSWSQWVPSHRGGSKACAPNVVVPIAQKLAKDINGHNTKACVRLDLKNSEHCLVQDRVSDVLRTISVRSDLSGVLQQSFRLPNGFKHTPERGCRSSPRWPAHLPFQAASLGGVSWLVGRGL